MGFIRWDFPLLGTGNEQGYTNSGIEFFKGKELLENLAREICQNSLDAKNPSVNGPVKVKFELKYISQSEHSLFADYKECISNCKDNWGARMDDRLREFIEGAESVLSSEQIPVLVASDYNTKGLEGVNASEDEESAWKALAHSDVTSVNKSEDSAGSYGIGKNAPFACTALSMVFYNTYAIDKGRAFQGTSRLATIKKNGKKTQGIGHYLCFEDEENWRPIFNEDNCSFFNEFTRDSFGTDIIIVGFIETDDWIERMTLAVVSNFFLAIQESKLIVDIQGRIIDAASISHIIDEYKDAKLVDTKVIYEWYQSLKDPDDGNPLYYSILEEDDVQLYLKTDNEFHNRAAYFRSSGMMIRKARPISFQHFAAVIVIRGDKLNKLLRKAEPVRHNRWDYKLIKDKADSIEVKKSLEQLDNWLRDELKKKYEIIGAKSQDSGEGEYLPDDADVSENSQQGDDILRVRQKISKSQSKIKAPGYIQTGAEPANGSPTPGKVHGNKKRRKNKKNKRVVAGPGNMPGANPAGSGAPLSTINIAAQKAFLLREDMGLYKIVIKTVEDYPKVWLAFHAIGEDNNEDILTVQKYTCDGKTKSVNGKAIGPFAFQKDYVKEIFVNFEDKEKMRLNIIASEVKRHD